MVRLRDLFWLKKRFNFNKLKLIKHLNKNQIDLYEILVYLFIIIV